MFEIQGQQKRYALTIKPTQIVILSKSLLENRHQPEGLRRIAHC